LVRNKGKRRRSCRHKRGAERKLKRCYLLGWQAGKSSCKVTAKISRYLNRKQTGGQQVSMNFLLNRIPRTKKNNVGQQASGCFTSKFFLVKDKAERRAHVAAGRFHCREEVEAKKNRGTVQIKWRGTETNTGSKRKKKKENESLI